MITADRYDAGVPAWLEGPERVFDLLAGLLVDGWPWSGQVLDIGCGTGTAGRRLHALGTDVLSLDTSAGMLAVARARSGGTALVADVLALPLADAVADGAVLGFVLNHLVDPKAGLAEVARVLRRGSRVVATTWAHDDPRDVQDAVEAVLLRYGWSAPQWYADFKATSSPQTDTVDGLARAAAALQDVQVDAVDVPFDLPAAALTAWRLGLSHTAPWLAGLSRREELVAEAVDAVAAVPAPRTRVLVLTARA